MLTSLIIQYVPPKSTPTPIIAPKKTSKTKTTETTLETLNPQLSSVSTQLDVSDEDENEDEEHLPQLTPMLAEFSKIPVRDYEPSWRFIQANREVVIPGATDALLVEAFAAEGRGEQRYSEQCVHQGLLLQYCDKLGPDGVSLFFKR
jgi:cell division cycle protein 37